MMGVKGTDSPSFK